MLYHHFKPPHLTLKSVLALTIAAFRSLTPLFHSNPLDEPWNTLMPAIWLQLILSSSIICTCIPTLKRVLADLQTGMMAGTVSDFFEQSISGQASTGDRSASKSDNSNGQRSGSGSASHFQTQRDLLGSEFMGSQRISRDNAILQTIDYGVYYEGGRSR